MEYKVSEEFIRECHAISCSSWKHRLEEEFPDVLKANNNRWYIHKDNKVYDHVEYQGGDSRLIFVEDAHHDGSSFRAAFGFGCTGGWISEKNSWGHDDMVEVTDTKVLRNAIHLRLAALGYKDNACTKSGFTIGNNSPGCVSCSLISPYTLVDGADIINDGILDPIDTRDRYTKGEAENKFNIKITNY